MQIAKVMGTAVASAKHAALNSTKILIICPANIDGDTCGEPFLAVDMVGSGPGELVIVSQGSSDLKRAIQQDPTLREALYGRTR